MVSDSLLPLRAMQNGGGGGVLAHVKHFPLNASFHVFISRMCIMSANYAVILFTCVNSGCCWRRGVVREDVERAAVC